MGIVESSVQLQEGHYVLKLPFKRENVTMPNNLCVAKQRIHGLRKTFQTNTRFHKEYTNFLSVVISKGYAEQVPQHTSSWGISSKEGNVASCVQLWSGV